MKQGIVAENSFLLNKDFSTLNIKIVYIYIYKIKKQKFEVVEVGKYNYSLKF